MMALVLTGLGEKLDGLLKPIKDKVFIKDKERLDQLLKTLILILLILVVMCFIPAGIFAAIEGWSYGDAVYYTLITLTTIGFGDFVIGKNLQVIFIFVLAIHGQNLLPSSLNFPFIWDFFSEQLFKILRIYFPFSKFVYITSSVSYNTHTPSIDIRVFE